MWLVYQIIWWPYSLRSITKGIYFFLFLINNVSQAARREQPRSPILARLVSGIRSPDFTKDKDKDKSHDNHGEKSNCVPTFTRSPPLPPTCPPSPLRNQMRSDHKQLSIPAYMSCIILVIVYVYEYNYYLTGLRYEKGVYLVAYLLVSMWLVCCACSVLLRYTWINSSVKKDMKHSPASPEHKSFEKTHVRSRVCYSTASRVLTLCACCYVWYAIVCRLVSGPYVNKGFFWLYSFGCSMGI